jgi:hypothetical protein
LTLVEVRDDDWPRWTVPGEEEAVGATRAELTVTETALEVTVFEALSVTLSSKCQVPVGVDAEVAKVKLDEVAPLIAE